MLATKPDDPWLIYNAAVAAYAAQDYARADEEWQRLAALPLPDDLREQVWLQIGNVSYRLVQPQIESEPDVVVPRLEQSREALRVALSANKKNKIAAQNLVFIEKELEKVYARLAQRLAQEARKEPSDSQGHRETGSGADLRATGASLESDKTRSAKPNERRSRKRSPRSTINSRRSTSRPPIGAI